MLQPRQHAARGTITASRPSLHHEICNVNSVDSKDASETLPGHGKSSSVDSSSNTVRKSSQSNQSPFCLPVFSANSALERILTDLGVEKLRNTFVKNGFTDLWLPLPKQLVRRVLKDLRDEYMKAFLDLQDAYLHTSISSWMWTVSEDNVTSLLFQYCAIEDDSEVVVENWLLGEGLVGVVEEVTVQTQSEPTICARKKIARPNPLRKQQDIMAAFIREIKVMRQVDRRHCVRFFASYTDTDPVNILSTSVADMDLARFLDSPIGDDEWKTLYRGIDCLCNAL